MRRVALFIPFLASVLVAEDPVLEMEEFVPSPHFAGHQTPLPPKQSTKWQPLALPDFPDFVSAADEAFALGLADPRGCVYRSVKIVTGNCWNGDAGIIKTRAWVLPSVEETPSTQFAVAWNGLVYPLVAVKGEADLASDLSSLFSEKENLYSFWMSRADNEPTGVRPNSSLISACLLLRLGEAETANRILHSILSDERHGKDEFAIDIVDHWLWNLYNRAVCAHMRGDDGLVHASLSLLASKIKAARQHIDAQLPEDRKDPDYHPLRWMNDWETLYVESQRRIRPVEDAPPSDPIAREVLDLENVNPRQWSQPGGVHVASDQRVHALVERGENSIEALLDCLENDSRLTRAVSFHRDFGRHRHLISVGEAAHSALTEILEVEEFEGASHRNAVHTGEERALMAQAIRRYWETNQNRTKPERWFATLLKDELDPDLWEEAAEKLTSPPVIYSDTGFGVFHVGRSKEDTTLPAGEPLRGKENPTVSEVLLKRSLELENSRKYREAISMASSLARWDALQNREELSEFVERFEGYLKAGSVNSAGSTLLGIKTLTEVRHKAGDPTAIGDYAKLMRQMTPQSVDSWGEDLFELLAKFPHVSSVQETINNLFGPDGPWNPLIAEDSDYRRAELVSLWPDLVKIPAFRENLLTCLSNTSKIGLITITENGIKLSGDSFGTSSQGSRKGEELPQEGTTYVLRVCDRVAHLMEKGLRKNEITFEVYRPAAVRDKQIASIVNWIKEG